MHNRLYQLRDGIPFRTGHLPDGTQVLVSRLGSEAIAIRFSRNGEFLGYDHYVIAPNVGVPDAEVDAVVNHLGVTPGLIRVHAFALPQHGIEIRATPDYLQEFLDRPEDFPEERARHLKKAVLDWSRKGSFVLLWGEDYEISTDGEVEST